MDGSDRGRLKPWASMCTDDSSIYFSHANLSDDPGPDIDDSMDAFDRRLLAESSIDGLQRGELALQRHSLPSHVRLTNNSRQVGKTRQEDLCATRLSLNASSSPSVPVSSPTVSLLRNRNQVLERPKPCKSYHFQTERNSLADDVFQTRTAPKVDARPHALPQTLLHPTPVIQGIPLVPTYQLPDHLRSVFKFELFNAVQSKCFSTAFESDENIVLSAPTGSGKTAVMELAICRILASNQNQDFKIIYQAPTKSLCSERNRDWASRFSTLGLKCAELTGDVEFAHLKAVQSAHIIVTTPEKWDSVTRKWKDNAKLMHMIKLFLVDEVHILNETRGATLEAVVSRMKSAGSGVRFVALSATIPNSDDIATWLGRSPIAQHLPAHREVFDEAFRPVKLEKHVVGYSCSPNVFALDSILTKEMPEIIARHAKRKPVMVFCITKASAAKTASSLAEMWFAAACHLRLWDAPKRTINVKASELQKLLPAGVAFHHGALHVEDRRAIETGFLEGDLNVVCSTSTLAVGINLPCYLVILKGTSCWSDHGLQEYSSLEIMQMLGRAGRPQYETSACAVILTQKEKVRRYEEMVSGQEVLESSLHENLIEHLNAEIGIGTVHDMETAKKWLTSSFLSVRLQRNPGYYRLQGSSTSIDADQLLRQIGERDVKLLSEAQLIEQGNGLRCTEYGDAMARYYIQYKTMLSLLQIPSKPKISEVLGVLVQAQEFCELKLRSGEKATYKQINKENDIRYPIKVDLALPSHKTSLLIQAHLGGVDPDKSNIKYSGQFKQDMTTVMTHCNRLIRCIIDIQIYRRDATGVKNALELCRSLSAGVWDNTPMQLKQIEMIGDVTARKLAAAGIKSVDGLLNTEARRIEVILGKSQPFGSDLHKKAIKFPNLRVSIAEVGRSRKEKPARVELRLSCEVGYLNETLPAFFNRKAVYVCFLCETSDGTLLDFRRFGVNRLRNGEQILLTALLTTRSTSVKAHVMCDEVAGTHRYAELKLDIPDAWLQREAATQIQAIAGNIRNANVSDKTDSFEDFGLKDEDFMAIDTELQDMEHPVNQDGNTTGNSMKRKMMAVDKEKPGANNFKEYLEPKQLANGNWTCQHNCNAEGKECKHQCCKEGVKRPKKRAKIQAQTAPASEKRSIKEAFAKSSTNTTRQNAEKIVDIDDILCKAVQPLEKNEDISISTDKDSVKLVPENVSLQARCPPRSNNVDYLESDDLPSMKDMLWDQNQQMKDSDMHFRNVEAGPKHKDSSDSQPDDIDLRDCDWLVEPLSVDEIDDLSVDFSTWLNSPKSMNGQIQAHTMTPASCAAIRSLIPHSKEPGLFVSPEKPDSSLPKPAPSPSEHEVFDAGTKVLDDMNASELAALHDTNQKLGEKAYSKSAISVSTATIKATDSRSAHQTSKIDSRHDTTVKAETEMQRRRRLHEEDQKRRWARLPAWLYEEFGAYVDLV